MSAASPEKMDRYTKLTSGLSIFRYFGISVFVRFTHFLFDFFMFFSINNTNSHMEDLYNPAAALEMIFIHHACPHFL